MPTLIAKVAPTDESKDTKTYEGLWSKIRDLINSDKYDEKYTKIKFNLNDI